MRTIDDYRIEPAEGMKHVAFRLHGPRGALYALVRTPNAGVFLLVNARTLAPQTLQGCGYFTNTNGRWRGMRART